MPNQDLVNYINEARRRGLSNDAIRTILLNTGWERTDIDAALEPQVVIQFPAQAQTQTSPVPHQEAAAGQSPLAAYGGGISGAYRETKPFFSELFLIYRSRFWVFIGLLVLGVVAQLIIYLVGLVAILVGGVSLTAVLISVFSKFSSAGLLGVGLGIGFWLLLATALLIFILWIQSIFQLSLINAALNYEKRLGIFASLRSMPRKAWHFLWLSLLMSVIVFGAFILGIIPGIFLSISFSLCAAVLIAEDQRLFNGLLRSRDLVRGHWWYVFGCLVAVAVPLIVVSFAFRAGTVLAIVGAVIFFLSLPLYPSATAALFRNLQTLQPQIIKSTAGRKLKYALFILAIPLAILLLVFTSLGTRVGNLLGSYYERPIMGGTGVDVALQKPSSGWPIGQTNPLTTFNDPELLKQTRDSQRISDLSTLKSLVQLYLADVSVPKLGCADVKTVYSSAKIEPPSGWKAGANMGGGHVDGTGWLPIDFTKISSGAPLKELLIDPVNDSNQHLVYLFACDPKTYSYEFNAVFESGKFNRNGESDLVSTDSGNNPDVYEIGSNLKLLPADFWEQR